MNCKYSAEHIEYITANIPGCHFKDLTNMFNGQFGMDLKVSAMISLTFRHGLHNGIDTWFNTGYGPTQFKKGNVPANKGMKGGGWEPTQFKKGNRSANWVPIGSERINGDGYSEIKIQDGKLQKNWKGKHIIIWEKENGLVPKGHAIIFGDGDSRNFDIKNLLLVSRRQLLSLNRNGLIQKDADLTRTALIVTDIYHKMSERKRNRR